MNVGGIVAHLDIYRELGVMHVHPAFGEGVRQKAADVLRNGDARHREALVRALCLDLEALRLFELFAEIALRRLKNGVLILLAGGGAAYRDRAEHRLHSLEGGVHIAIVRLRLNVGRGLDGVDPEIAEAAKPPPDVCHKLILKYPLVKALEHDLPVL